MGSTEIEELYRTTLPPLCSGDWKEWKRKYLQFVQRVGAATRDEWFTPAFQELLWESNDVCGVGMGTSVVLATAFADREIATALWNAREATLPKAAAARGDAISATFENVMSLVTPKHNKRRPSAKLVRALTAIFPLDVLCLVDDWKTKQVRSALGLKKQGEHFLRQHVRLREELRELVGPEESLEHSIERSMFTWLLYEGVVRKEEEEAGTVVSVPPPPPGPGPVASPMVPPLRLLPRDQQYAGINHVKDALRLMHTMVRDAEHGIARKALVAEVTTEAPYLSAKSANMQVGIAHARLGLLELHEGEIFRPTKLGRELLEGETATNVVTPVLLRRVFGFAQLLDLLRRKSEGLTRSQIASELRTFHPGWTTDMTAGAILDWCTELELVQRELNEDGVWIFTLSDVGTEWASRLPLDLRAWNSKVEADEEDGAGSPEGFGAPEPRAAALQAPAFEAIAARFTADALLRQLVLPKDMLALLHGALHAMVHKRFVLLSGLSGTGKTSLARAYAQAYCEAAKVPFEKHFLCVPVSPDWSDPSGLLGYVSPLGDEPSFHATQALELLLSAARQPDKPFFLCLDEMNLARVEHYFAPFLSAMEGARSVLSLHGSRDAVDNVPPTIPWPMNLFVIGTVNVDETTHAFSDKVLDRAFSFELWDVDLPAWRAHAAEHTDAKTLATVFAALSALHEALRPARRHFGYRTCNEVMGFCAAVPEASRPAALDAAVLAKVLPKVRGDDSGALPAALKNALDACNAHGLVRSAERLAAMQQSLATLGVVRFAS